MQANFDILTLRLMLSFGAAPLLFVVCLLFVLCIGRELYFGKKSTTKVSL